jgi:capsular exopolysaccharide synthesis family protein
MAARGNLSSLLAYPAAEEFRRLGADLQLAYSQLRSVVVAGTTEGEGATSVSVNLAFALAGQGRTVLLVDGNLRRPALHHLFDVPLSDGLAEWDGTVNPPFRPTAIASNLHVLTAGAARSDARLDQCAQLGMLTKHARERFEYVIWDSAPVGAAPDALVLASVADGLLLVIEADRTENAALEVIREQIERAGVRLLGVVMNRYGRFLPRALRRS